MISLQQTFDKGAQAIDTIVADQLAKQLVMVSRQGASGDELEAITALQRDVMLVWRREKLLELARLICEACAAPAEMVDTLMASEAAVEFRPHEGGIWAVCNYAPRQDGQTSPGKVH